MRWLVGTSWSSTGGTPDGLTEADVERALAAVPEHLIETQTRVRLILVDLALVARRSRRHGIVEDVERRPERDVLLRERHEIRQRDRARDV